MNLGLWGSISPKTILGAIRRGAGGLSDTTAPSVSTFTATSPATSLTISITAFTASEAGVSFLITENSTPPLAGAAGWSASVPTTYVVTAGGTYTLYPWVKDAAGNVSSVFGSPVSVIVPYLIDTFTGTDGTLLTAHTPDVVPVGSSWGAVFATYGTVRNITIQSNKAAVSAPSEASNCTVIDAGESDVKITDDITTVNQTGYGGNSIIFRYVDTSNFWEAEIVPGANIIRIKELSGGVSTARASATVTIAVDTQYSVILTAVGQAIAFTVAGTTINHSSTSHQTATKHGISLTNVGAATTKHDNFIISDPT